MIDSKMLESKKLKMHFLVVIGNPVKVDRKINRESLSDIPKDFRLRLTFTFQQVKGHNHRAKATIK